MDLFKFDFSLKKFRATWKQIYIVFLSLEQKIVLLLLLTFVVLKKKSKLNSNRLLQLICPDRNYF